MLCVHFFLSFFERWMLIFLQIAAIGLLANKSNFRKNNSTAIGGKEKKKKQNWKETGPHPLTALPQSHHGCNSQTVSHTSDSIMMQRKRIKKSYFRNMRVRMGKTPNIVTWNIQLQKLLSYLLMCEEYMYFMHLCACISPEPCRCRCLLAPKVNGKSIKKQPWLNLQQSLKSIHPFSIRT